MNFERLMGIPTDVQMENVQEENVDLTSLTPDQKHIVLAGLSFFIDHVQTQVDGARHALSLVKTTLDAYEYAKMKGEDSPKIMMQNTETGQSSEETEEHARKYKEYLETRIEEVVQHGLRAKAIFEKLHK